MFRSILAAVVIVGSASQVLAAEITSESLVGRYKVSARYVFLKYYMNFNVLENNEFEVQRAYSDGSVDEVCNGTFKLDARKVFRGVATCPSNRSKTLDLNVDFRNKTTEDLENGTTVSVTSSLAKGRTISANVIKKN